MDTDRGSKVSGKPIAVYVFAALGFLFFGLLGHDFPPAFYIAVGLAVLCLVQAYIQIFAIWLVVFALYAVGAAFYGWLLISDLVRLARDQPTTVLLDFDDSAIFISSVVLMLGVAIWLMRSRPRQKGQVSDV